MTITIKKATLSGALTAAHAAISESAVGYHIRPIEMRVLMFISDTASGTVPRTDEIDSGQIENGTGIIGSNVRKALYELHSAGLIEFIEKERFRRLVVTQTQAGINAADECRYHWEGMMGS